MCPENAEKSDFELQKVHPITFFVRANPMSCTSMERSYLSVFGTAMVWRAHPRALRYTRALSYRPLVL